MDNDAFLLARVTGWEQYNLLAGEANIFFEGIHYLNPLRYRFQTSNIKNKKNVIEEIKNYLNKYSEEELDEMVNRKAMYTL